MNRLQNAILVLLFCLFPLRFLIQWLPILEYPFIATLLVSIEYVCLTYLMMCSLIVQRTHQGLWAFRFFQAIYWIYSAYLVYYIIIEPQLPREIMLHVPTSDTTVFQNIIIIALACSMVTLYQEYVNYSIFLKLSTVLLIFLIIIHNITGNMSVYMIQGIDADIEEKMELLKRYRMLDGFTLAKFSSYAFLFNLWLKNSWTKNPYMNSIIFGSIAVVAFLAIIIAAQRGPLLALFITVVFFYYCKGKLGIKAWGATLAFSCIISMFSTEIITFLSNHSLLIVERFMSISDDGGSGRFGSSESEYALAWRQIGNGPIWGTYFRTLIGSRIGNYPHNFILELLMTFGLVFTIPFLLLLWHCIKNCMYAISNNMEIGALGLLFIFQFTEKLMSESLVLDTVSWVLMAMMLCINRDEDFDDNDNEERDDNDDEYYDNNEEE